MRRVCLFVLLACALCACDSTAPIVEGDFPVREISTRLILTGDIELGEPLPMFMSSSRVSNDHLYGVQIYSRVITPSSATYKPFAYGVFDDLSKIAVELPDNMLYRFCITMVADGKTRVATTQGALREPFSVGSRFFEVNNTFAYSSSVVLTGIFIGSTAVNDGSSFGHTVHKRPDVDRYSGEVADFRPREGVNIEVELKRVVFGIRLTAIGLKEGYVELSIEDAPPMRLYSGQSKTESIFTLKGLGVANLWTDASYMETIVCKAKWVKADKTEVVLGSSEGRQLSVKRKQMYPVSVRVGWDAVGGDITMEDGALIEQDEIIF